MKEFPRDVEDLANTFVTMQMKRHQADYDPSERFYKSSVQQDIAQVEDVIQRFSSVSIKNRRAFAAFVLFRKRTECRASNPATSAATARPSMGGTLSSTATRCTAEAGNGPHRANLFRHR